MKNLKEEIIDEICCSEFVCGRIKKKLNIELPKGKIEVLILTIITETDEVSFQKEKKYLHYK